MDMRTESDEDNPFQLENRWRAAIDTAATEPELMSVAREFVAAFPQAELAALPTAWKPRKLRSAHDVSLITFRLAKAYCGPKLDSGNERSMRPLLAFFQALSGRLFAVRGRAAQH